MQTDEEIGKVAAAVPVLISKCLEMFLASLLTKAGDVTKSKRAKTMSRSHLKQCIMTETMFDFLKDHVVDIPDVQNEDEASGSMNFLVEKEPAKKVVRKRSSSKVKKTPKKRQKLGHHTNNNDSEDESDSGDYASDNGSGNDESDAQSSFSSPGLLSPSVQSKLEIQSTSSSHNQMKPKDTTVEPERKSSIHIPLDALLSTDDLPSTVSLNRAVKIESTQSSEESGENNKDEMLKETTQLKDGLPLQKSNKNEKQHDSTERQGVIVPNTALYSQPGSESGRNIQNNLDQKSSKTSKPSETMPSSEVQSNISMGNEKQKSKNSLIDTDGSNEPVQHDIPPVIPKPGGMLSFLYSSVPVSLPQLPVPPTVSPAQTMLPQVKYAYSPLTQHTYSEPTSGQRQPLMYPGVRPSINDNPRVSYPQKAQPNTSSFSKNEQTPGPSSCVQQRAAAPYPYPYTPYDPSTTQRHYLGYPQSILTPPSHHLVGVNANFAAHPSLQQVKPSARAVSDDDDYDA